MGYDNNKSAHTQYTCCEQTLLSPILVPLTPGMATGIFTVVRELVATSRLAGAFALFPPTVPLAFFNLRRDKMNLIFKQ